MPTHFTQSDLDIFHIPDFSGRMGAIKEQIRPKLLSLGEELCPAMTEQFKKEFFAHTAKHMRRKVNPPDETWVAFGPQSRAYKAYVFFAFCIGKNGGQLRVTMKDESALRPALGKNLQANQKLFERQSAALKKLSDYTRRDQDYQPALVEDLSEFITKSSERLQTLKTAIFDVGLPINPISKSLSSSLLRHLEALMPFYECGLKAGVRL